MRKIRHTPSHNSIVKAGIGNLITKSSASISYVQRSPLDDLELSLWAKFDDVSFDGISVVAEGTRGIKTLTLGSGSINLYSVEQGKGWQKTFISSKPIQITGNVAKVDFLSSELPSFSGDVTFFVEAVAFRQSEKVTARAYFNHLGILEPVTKNRSKIKFLEITKADE
jgi:hypothetical protein